MAEIKLVSFDKKDDYFGFNKIEAEVGFDFIKAEVLFIKKLIEV